MSDNGQILMLLLFIMYLFRNTLFQKSGKNQHEQSENNFANDPDDILIQDHNNSEDQQRLVKYTLRRRAANETINDKKSFNGDIEYAQITNINSMTIDPFDENLLYVMTQNDLYVIDLTTKNITNLYKSAVGNIGNVVVSPFKEFGWLMFSNGSKNINFFKLNAIGSNLKQHALPVKDNFYAFAFDDISKYVYIGTLAGEIYECDLKRNTSRVLTSVTGNDVSINAIEFDVRNNAVYFATNRTVYSYNLTSNEESTLSFSEKSNFPIKFLYVADDTLWYGDNRIHKLAPISSFLHYTNETIGDVDTNYTSITANTTKVFFATNTRVYEP